MKNSATFTGIPDIPLTSLHSLEGGADGLFLSTCQTPTGTATASLSDQNGDNTATAPSTSPSTAVPGSGGNCSSFNGRGRHSG